MRIILTHEQADFDAIASLLGAYLLNETALPVLPRKTNRNVRSFLILYGVDLPFIDPQDLPAEPVESVTIVDTQSLVTVKGITSKTRVHAIDHHPQREKLPQGWTIDNVEIGATTSFITENLRDRDISINTIEATLLLLGIYEDTGSLTYTRTTSRDLQAAAFLLDRGASLQIAGDFLNHPLSLNQQILYDQLRQKVDYIRVHGHNIVVACGDAHEMDEELSTVAHKLRDLLDPDALFVMVETKGGVQLIARSSTEHVDVAEIAAYFGGGGHERAAAGLIRDRELENIRAELIQILPNYVRPAITVAQIMSKSPQLLSRSTSLEEIALRMRRYGYEGFPVVETIPNSFGNSLHSGSQKMKVVGLVTRRAVDRALAHNLNYTAGSLMEAGDYTVYPDDSIEHLQRVMTDSGWGQIPVLQPESGEIIAIVTRTDLLKILTPQTGIPAPEDLRPRIERSLPSGKLALLKVISEAAYEQHVALYVVGGFVRDLLLDQPSIDFDLVVEGDAISLAKSLMAKYGGRVTSHSRFGTAKWHIDPFEFQEKFISTHPEIDGYSFKDLSAHLDLVTARTEYYTQPTALPTVERGSIKLDLHRRDFTINTLALRLDGHHYGELHDYWGGLNDLRIGLVRVLHSLSFVDDPTRMLRAVRFEQRFGFHIEERTLQLMEEAITLLDRVSGDRIRHELNHMMLDERAANIFERLHQLGLLKAIHPNLTWDRWLHNQIESLSGLQPHPDWGLNNDDAKTHLKENLGYILLMIRLPVEAAKPVCDRLKFAVHLSETILAACNLWLTLPKLRPAKPSQVVACLENEPVLAQYAVYLGTPDSHLKQTIELFATKWSKITPTLSGDDLRFMGIPPGPVYRSILNSLRNAWIDGEITSKDEETALLTELLKNQN